MAEETESRVDGNALAGPLGELFALDVTAAHVICVGCDKDQVVGALEVYGTGPGLVARCRGCHDVIVRVARTPGQVYLDLRGTVSLRVAV